MKERHENLKFERGVDAVISGYARVHALLFTLTVAATFLPLWEKTPGAKPGGTLWQLIGRSEGISPTLMGLGVLAILHFVLVVALILRPRGMLKPLGILVLSAVFAGALLFLPDPGYFPASGAYALLACFVLSLLSSLGRVVHAAILQRRAAKLSSGRNDGLAGRQCRWPEP